MTDEQDRFGEIEPITDAELELVALFQQYVTVGPHRRQIWLADLARELLQWRRAAATPGTVEEATKSFKRQAAAMGRIDRGP